MRTKTLVALVVIGGMAMAAVGVALHQGAAVGFAVGTMAIIALARHETRAPLFGEPRARLDESSRSPRCASLVVMAYPDELEALPSLLAAAGAPSNGLAVLAIDVVASGGRGRLPTDGHALLRNDERLRTALAGAGAEACRSFAFMTARGPDPALVTLEVARKIGASDVFSACQDPAAGDEDELRATRAWETLAPPKQALSVHLVDVRERGPQRTFSLRPSGPKTTVGRPPVVVG